MQKREPYKNLKQTLLALKNQVIDSLPCINKYIPSDISNPEQLFYFLKDKITYKKDPIGVELLQCVQTLFSKTKYNDIGEGDCDCFTILSLAAFEYLGFHPCNVVLVGNSKNTPSHIYTTVYDPEKNRMCVFDLTNPYYDMERPYKYKQTLKFMILELADNFLSGKSARKARKSVKKENKLKRKTSRQVKRTNRVENKAVRKDTKQKVKIAKKDKKLIRVKGKQEIIQARQQKQLDKARAEQAEATLSPSFSPESDESYIPNESTMPGSSYQTSGADDFTDYEMMPDEDDMYQENPIEYDAEYEDEGDGLSFGFIPGAIKLVSNAITKAQQGKVGQVIQKGSAKYNEIAELQRKYTATVAELEREKTNKLVFSIGGTLGGIIVGTLIGRAIK